MMLVITARIRDSSDSLHFAHHKYVVTSVENKHPHLTCFSVLHIPLISYVVRSTFRLSTKLKKFPRIYIKGGRMRINITRFTLQATSQTVIHVKFCHQSF